MERTVVNAITRIVATIGLGLLLTLQGAAQSTAATPFPAQQQPGGSALEPNDRELLVKARLAGLWETPTGRQAVERASTERVKEVGEHLASDHTLLDQDVREVAGQLGVPLPDQPNDDQKAWMAEISSKSGTDYDRTFANRLRAAHGTVFGVAAQVRAATRNDIVRAFAQRAVAMVMKHMTLLESTGFVQSGSLLVASTAAVGKASVHDPNNVLSGRDLLLAVAVGLLAAAGTLAVIRVFGSYRKTTR